MKKIREFIFSTKGNIITAFVAWTAAGIDSIIQGTNYSFDIKTLEYLSIYGKIFFWIGAVFGVVFLVRFVYSHIKR